MKIRCLILAILVSAVCMGQYKSHDNGPGRSHDNGPGRHIFM